MAITYFEELGGSPSIKISLSGQSAKREAIIPWANIVDCVIQIFPPDGAPSALNVDWPWLTATAMQIEPFGGEKTRITAPIISDLTYDALNETGFAKVTIEYETSAGSSGELPEVDPVPLLTHRWTIGGEFLTLESEGLHWCDGAKVDPTDAKGITVGLLIPTIEHQITWPRVAKPPFETIRDRIGTVNDDFMDFQTGTIYKETLVFLGAELQRDIKSDGVLAWEVSYRFSERRVKSKSPTQPTLTTKELCETYGGVWTGGSSPFCSGANVAACQRPDNHDDCIAAGGTWTGPYASGSCGDYVGGWNHYYRSDAIGTGWTRLLTKASAGQPAGPIYQLRSFDDLFVEDL